MNIGILLQRHARYRPHYTAVVWQDQRFTFRKFNRRVNRLMNDSDVVALTTDACRFLTLMSALLIGYAYMLQPHWLRRKEKPVGYPDMFRYGNIT